MSLFVSLSIHRLLRLAAKGAALKAFGEMSASRHEHIRDRLAGRTRRGIIQWIGARRFVADKTANIVISGDDEQLLVAA
ncbi:hypothetical protein [Hyphococcus sp.]|uniref:hypothetical protein n=1 Tax=Hyphococcus sp. TaxID=2038636 RepID=UPI003D105FF6